MLKFKLNALIVMFIVVGLIGCGGITKCDSDEKISEKVDNEFTVRSFKGKVYTFKNIETGIVNVSPENRKKMFQVDKNGSLKYYTEEVVGSFNAAKEFSSSDGVGFAARFEVPEIENNDYVIIDAVIKLPVTVKIGNKQTAVINGSFRYDKKNAGKKEYIWYLFEKNSPQYFIKGNWQLQLYSSDKEILITTFKSR